MKFNIGDDIGFAEVMEVCSNGDLVIEFPNRKRKVILKRDLEKLENDEVEE